MYTIFEGTPLRQHSIIWAQYLQLVLCTLGRHCEIIRVTTLHSCTPSRAERSVHAVSIPDAFEYAARQLCREHFVGHGLSPDRVHHLMPCSKDAMAVIAQIV